jgi:regulator of nonsense transcripts 2
MTLTLVFIILSDNENRDTPHYKLMILLEQDLPECHRREQIDEIAERFCSTHGSSKNARKRLQQTLFSVPQSRLDLLPYYSRMAATVDRVWVDIASMLVTDLEQQFHGQAKYKKNQNLDSRMKTARYIGELTKFRVAPPIVGLRCMQRCIDDFTGCNVDVACCLLESCGRFLYRTRHAGTRLLTLMDTMTRLSKAKVSFRYLTILVFVTFLRTLLN